MTITKPKRSLSKTIAVFASATLLLTGVSLTLGQASADVPIPARPDGPCDIYDAAGFPCVSVHSTTRALYAAYDGPLYQVVRMSDNTLKDIPIVQPSPGDAGGYANAAVQDEFCANTMCYIARIYDQSPMENDLYRAPRGGFSGDAMGGNNNLPVADRAPVSIMGGHKVYGAFVIPGTGLRNNDTIGIAIDDEAESMYWVINGRHYNSGCCFDYGNGETDSRDDGDGTMETLYFGNSTGWGRGKMPGPWLMTDQENNLLACTNVASGSTSRVCDNIPPITDRFVVGMATFKQGHWTNQGANAKSGTLDVYYAGARLNGNYNPMRKQGSIILGNGGDNSVQSQGTFYEGVMTTGFSDAATDQKIHDNVKAAKYDEYQVVFEPTDAAGESPQLMTFAPGASQNATLSWTNTTGVRAAVVLSIESDGKYGVSPAAKTFLTGVAPGATVKQDFKITGGAKENNADLVGTVTFLSMADPDAATQTENAIMHGRNTASVKINEFSAATSSNTTDAFIELYNSGTTAANISGWTVSYHANQIAPSSTTATVPANTTLGAGQYYVLGLATSGLASPIKAGATNIKVRSTTGLSAGNTITIGTGANAETAVIATGGVGSVASTQSASSVIFMPLPPECVPVNCPGNEPALTFPAGTTNLPITSTTGFTAGQQVLVGYGDTAEILTIATGGVGTAGAQTWLAPSINDSNFQTYAMQAPAGVTNLKVRSVSGFYAGMNLRLDIDKRYEWVKVQSVGTAGLTGSGITLTAPTTKDHSNNMSLAARGTGITFTTGTAFAHSSSEPIRPLGVGITLTAPLTKNHPIDDVVLRTAATTAGFQGTPNQWFGGPALSTSAGNITLRTAEGNVADSLNYGRQSDPWLSEGYQGGGPGSGCKTAVPATGGSVGRYPDGTDTDSNCYDFVSSSTRSPNAPSTFTMPTGAQISLQLWRDPSLYIVHKGETIMMDAVTAASSKTDKQNATWIATPSLSNTSGCVSFMAVNQLGSYMRHSGYVYSLNPNDGSTLFASDATFCPVRTVGTSSPVISIQNGPETDIRFRSSNYNTRYLRTLDGMLFLALSGGSQSGDTSVGYTNDIRWNTMEGWGQSLDKDSLQALVDQVLAMNSGHFANWTAIIPGPLAAAQVVLATFSGPPQPDIDAAYNTLAAAVAALTPIMANVAMANPVLTGDAMVGHTLTVTASAFPADTVFTYQWYVSNVAPCDTNGVPIAGETADTYVVQAADAGKYVCAKVTGSVPTGPIGPASKFSGDASIQVPIVVSKAILGGSNAVGGIATIDLAYTPTDATYTVEWYRNGTDLIAGANTLNYTVQQADSGGTLVAKITVSKSGYDSVSVFTNTMTIQGSPPPCCGVYLTPAGPVTAGQTVTLVSNISPADAFVLIEWYVGGNVVMISTNPFGGNSYTPTAADAGKTIVAKVTVYVPSFSPLVLFSNVVDVF